MAYLKRSEAGVKLYYQTRGEGPPLLLINGLSQSVANWTTQAAALRKHFRVIMFDGRGQGRSDLGQEPLSLQTHVEDVVALLDHLEIDQAYVAGFSHGARVGLRLAADHPDRVSRLVLTGQGADDEVSRHVTLRVWREVLRLGGAEALAWCSVVDILSTDFLKVHADQLDVMIRTTVQRNTTEGLSAMLDALLAYSPSLDDAARVQCPTLVCSADQDPLCSDRAARRLVHKISSARHVKFTDCGHTIPIEQPHRWRTEVLAFWDRPDPA